MQSKSNFSPASVPELSNKAREAVNAVFGSVSDWRNDVAAVNKKNSKQVVQKMARAATTLGWPEEVVDATRVQMESINDMQVKTMDRIMEAWEEQLKLPNPTASPSAMLTKLQSMPSFGATGDWPSAESFQMAATAPLRLWIEFGRQWQKFWLEGMNKANQD
jgi:hypothetical protein